MTIDQTNKIVSRITDAVCNDISAIVFKMAEAVYQEAESITQSPIEAAFLAAFITSKKADNRLSDKPWSRTVLVPSDCEFESGFEDAHVDRDRDLFFVFVIQPQSRIDSYRVDFLTQLTVWHKESRLLRKSKKVVVECDGHDFHERTAEQAEHDRSRDRFMQSLDYPVLRFTGKELWRDPVVSADELSTFLVDDVARQIKRDRNA